MTSVLVSSVRLFRGQRVLAQSRRPERLLQLYEFEACPYCRRLRETLSALDLEVMVFPCPKRGRRFRPRVSKLGGKTQFPFLVDPNTGLELYESEAIMVYLSETYAGRSLPARLRPGALAMLGLALSSLPRPHRGLIARASRYPAHALELWSYEASPFCRLVRERLSELELPYVLYNVAQGSPRRELLGRRAGKLQLPLLVDPNTNAEYFGSRPIIAYLERTYAL